MTLEWGLFLAWLLFLLVKLSRIPLTGDPLEPALARSRDAWWIAAVYLTLLTAVVLALRGLYPAEVP